MVLFSPICGTSHLNTGHTLKITTRSTGPGEKAAFASALASVRWDDLYKMNNCNDQFQFYQSTLSALMELCFPLKVVTRHTSDKPWVTDAFRNLIRRRQRARMAGNITLARLLRNKVNRAAACLRQNFYRSKIASLDANSSRDWWKYMKSLMGLSSTNDGGLQGLANATTDGDLSLLANNINDFFVSVSSALPRLDGSHPIFQLSDPVPDEFIISVDTTKKALDMIKINKATGPDGVPAWILREFSNSLAAPLTAIFNSSVREGVVPVGWKTADVIPLPKKHPPRAVESDIRPISLTPIAAKVFESIIIGWVTQRIKDKLDPKQFGCTSGTGTTDALVEMVHRWYEATDKTKTFVRVALLDYSKAFDHINHHILIKKFENIGLEKRLIRWMAAFLLDRVQRVKVGSLLSDPGHPNGGVPQGTLSGPKDFLILINDLATPCPIYKYVDDSTIFEICERGSVSVIQESVDIACQWSVENDMKINANKTQELLICFCKDSTHAANLPNIVVDDKPVARVNQAKILGIVLSSDLTWNAHVDYIVSKACKRLYMLYQLKRAGINQSDLLTIYKSVIRPVLEYACQVWHSSLPKYLDDKIETVQKRALKSIYPGLDYKCTLHLVNMKTLGERRSELCKIYFNKLKDVNHRLHHLLPAPRTMRYTLRSAPEYPCPRTRTNRFKNSLIPWCLSNQ